MTGGSVLDAWTGREASEVWAGTNRPRPTFFHLLRRIAAIKGASVLSKLALTYGQYGQDVHDGGYLHCVALESCTPAWPCKPPSDVVPNPKTNLLCVSD